MSNFQLPQTSFGPTANPITAGRASVPGISGSIGSGLSGAGKQMTLQDEINQAVQQLAAMQQGSVGHAALTQKLYGLLQLRAKSAPTVAPGVGGGAVPPTGDPTATPPTSTPPTGAGGGFGGGAVNRAPTTLELLRGLNPSDPRQQKINEAVLAAEATSDPTLRVAMLNQAHAHARDMAREAEDRETSARRARVDERAQRQANAQSKHDMDRFTRWMQTKQGRSFITPGEVTAAFNDPNTRNEFEAWKKSSAIVAGSAVQPGQSAAVQAHGYLSGHPELAKDGSVGRPVPGAVLSSQAAQKQIDDARALASGRQTTLASDSFRQTEQEVQAARSAMRAAGLDPATEMRLEAMYQSGQITPAEMLRFVGSLRDSASRTGGNAASVLGQPGGIPTAVDAFRQDRYNRSDERSYADALARGEITADEYRRLTGSAPAQEPEPELTMKTVGTSGPSLNGVPVRGPAVSRGPSSITTNTPFGPMLGKLSPASPQAPATPVTPPPDEKQQLSEMMKMLGIDVSGFKGGPYVEGLLNGHITPDEYRRLTGDAPEQPGVSGVENAINIMTGHGQYKGGRLPAQINGNWTNTPGSPNFQLPANQMGPMAIPQSMRSTPGGQVAPRGPSVHERETEQFGTLGLMSNPEQALEALEAAERRKLNETSPGGGMINDPELQRIREMKKRLIDELSRKQSGIFF